ncbi:MAG: hypothetical protein IT445_15910 [Phycisphaeraceae bacterium]|nr:hypothetical protein [Phycisphaeraceae bacterium]
MTQADRDRCEQLLKLVESMLLQGRLEMAYRYAVLADSVAGFDAGMRTKIKATAAKVTEAANKVIKDADQLSSEGKFAEAIDLYAKISGLKHIPSSKEALRKLADLRRNPAAQSSLRQILAMQKLEQVLHAIDLEVLGVEVVTEEPQQGDDPAKTPEAVEAVTEPGFDLKTTVAAAEVIATEQNEQTDQVEDDSLSEVDLALLLETPDRIKFIDGLESVVTHYGDTSAGQRAQTLIEQLHACDLFMNGLEEFRINTKVLECLSMAQQYEGIGMIDLAIEQYRMAYETAPDSESGRAAQAALARLKR